MVSKYNHKPVNTPPEIQFILIFNAVQLKNLKFTQKHLLKNSSHSTQNNHFLSKTSSFQILIGHETQTMKRTLNLGRNNRLQSDFKPEQLECEVCGYYYVRADQRDEHLLQCVT